MCFLSALPELHAAEKSIKDQVLKVVGEVERRRQDPGGNVCQLVGVAGSMICIAVMVRSCKTQQETLTILAGRQRCKDLYGDRILAFYESHARACWPRRASGAWDDW